MSNLAVSAEGVGLGWKPEPFDFRDYIFMDRSAKKMKTMKQLADLQRSQTPDPNLLGPRRNQHAEGSCTGHGMCSAGNRITRQDGDRFNTVYGPRYNYNLARILEGCAKDAEGKPLLNPDGTFVDPGPWIKQDQGAYVRDVVLGARRYGMVPESFWKYRAAVHANDGSPGAKDYQKVPSPSRMKAATRMRIEAHRCQTVEEILSALAANCPVVFGFPCFSNMWTREVDRTGVIPMPAGYMDGGHCECGHWYNMDFPIPQGRPGIIWAENSWSDQYAPESPSGIAGMNGLPLEFVWRGWADDMWAIVKEAE